MRLTTAAVGLFVAGWVLWGAACSIDDSRPGVRDNCSFAGGAGLPCDDSPIENAVDACWRLVDCGVIPIDNPEDDPECCFSWRHCVAYMAGLEDYRREFSLACVEASSCDDLKTDGSPDRPSRGERGVPVCLQHGDQ